MTGFVDGERAVDVIRLDFTTIFNMVSHEILIRKLKKCSLDTYIGRYITDCILRLKE